MKARYGLLGYPLGHSFSASYFADKFQREGIDAEYLNFEYATVNEALPLLRQMPTLRGFNVTIPHKQAIMPHLDALSPAAQAIGAVNVVSVVHDAAGGVRLLGDNSDVVGFCRSLAPLLHPAHHTHALVLGTGGASRAVVHGLKSLGLTPTYVSRSSKPGQLTYDELTPAVMQQHKVIVNCSPVGMFPHTDEAPRLPYHLLTPSHLLYDLVYNPLTTRFMQLGAERGCKVKNGLEMLHIQAEVAWQMWHAAH